ncbi:MAG TPA: malonate decarboxylase subunit alpha [Firmicutes bacterium]|nr:malonate decarboxylase subunit alpha [Bacillota bacterium]
MIPIPIPEFKVMNSKKLLKQDKLASVANLLDGKLVKSSDIVAVLEKVIRPNETVAIEGDNQKQAVDLAKALVQVDPAKVNGLRMVMSCVQMPEHLDIFEKGIAKELNCCYIGGQSARLPQMIDAGTVKLGAIHTYLEMFSRMFTDLIPNVCLCVAEAADRNGNLYTGPNTEETPTIIEATACKDGIVIVQVNEIMDELPRIDIQGEWVDIVMKSDEPCYIDPLMTRDPAKITNLHILQAMMIIKGVYARHHIDRMNHGIGYVSAALELLLPTYGEELGLKGKICKNWVANPIPAMIPAIECGWAESCVAFGSEVGMQEYVKARSDIFFTGVDGLLRSNRCYAQMAGLYGCDMFTGSTLQMDYYGNSSTVTKSRITGYGGAPNMGSNPNGRRHTSEAWCSMVTDHTDVMAHGRKLVTQIVRTQTLNKKTGEMRDCIVPQLDAVETAKKAGLPEPLVMIHGDDVTHLVTEVGLAYLYMANNKEERKELIAAVAGNSALGQTMSDKRRAELRNEGKIMFPEDLGIDPATATRDRLSAQTLEDIVEWSHGLYTIPDKFLEK